MKNHTTAPRALFVSPSMTTWNVGTASVCLNTNTRQRQRMAVRNNQNATPKPAFMLAPDPSCCYVNICSHGKKLNAKVYTTLQDSIVVVKHVFLVFPHHKGEEEKNNNWEDVARGISLRWQCCESSVVKQTIFLRNLDTCEKVINCVTLCWQ